MKSKLLVTGASGLVGGHVAARAREGWEVHGVYHRHRVSMEGIQWHRLDLTDEPKVEALVHSLAPHAIVHAAAMTDVDRAEIEHTAAEAANVAATGILAETAAAVGARFVYVSTDMVLDGEGSWYTENDPARPINFYGQTKLHGELIVAERCSSYAIARTALVYGTAMFSSRSASAWLIEAIRSGRRVQLFDDQYRTPIWVENLADALLELCQIDWNGRIHLGGPERLSRFEFGLRVCRAFSLPEDRLQRVSMDSVQLPAPRPRDASLDTTLARSLLRTVLVDCNTALKQARSREAV